MQYTSSIWWQTFNMLRKLVWLLTCVSISSILCRVSRSSAWASASRNLTLINSSCISLSAFFLGLSFQRPAVRAKWRWGEALQSVTFPPRFALWRKCPTKIMCWSHCPVCWHVLTCQCSSKSLTCCLSSLRPVRASASLSFTPISSSWRRATLVSSGRDVFLWGRSVRIICFKTAATYVYGCKKTSLKQCIMPEVTHLLHVQDLVLHFLEGTLRLRLLQPGLHQLSLQLQDRLLRVPRGSLLQQDTCVSTDSKTWH